MGLIAGDTIFTAGMDAASQQATNAWSAAEAQKQRDWQEEMSNTAHQREVDDLKAAGLNPILSAGGGSGASTPVGAKPDLKAGHFGSNLMKFANSAADTKKKKAEHDVIQNQARLVDANIAKVEETAKGIALDNQLKAEKNAVYSQVYGGVKDVMHDTSETLDGIGINPTTALGVGALAAKFTPWGRLGSAVASSGKLLKKVTKVAKKAKYKGSGVRVQTATGKGDSGWSSKKPFVPEHMKGEGANLWRGHHSSQVPRR